MPRSRSTFSTIAIAVHNCTPTCGTTSPFLTTLTSSLIRQERIPAGAFKVEGLSAKGKTIGVAVLQGNSQFVELRIIRINKLIFIAAITGVIEAHIEIGEQPTKPGL